VRRRLSIFAYLALYPAAASAQATARFDDPPSGPTRSEMPAPEPWARSAARGLVERAAQLERRGDTADAMRVYNEAIRMDPSFGRAYLALARVRHSLRDFGEAERLYSAAVRLPDTAADALEQRARMQRDRGNERGAFTDLRAAIELDPNAHGRLRTLAAWYVERQAWPAALAAFRRLAATLESTGTREELRQARVQIRALGLLAGDADPVTAGHDHPSAVRRSLARIDGAR
jgi:tetratricopeptide (TPR) repeat protein